MISSQNVTACTTEGVKSSSTSMDKTCTVG
jgi:hypothetical protein